MIPVRFTPTSLRLPLELLVPDASSASSAEKIHLAGLLQLANDALEATGIPWLTITSWLRREQTGDPHAEGAAIDYAGPTREDTGRLWAWIARHRRSSVGELILELPKTGATGHVHQTLPGYGGHGQILYQLEGGGYLEVDPTSLDYSATGVVEIPGLTVTVSRGRGALWLALLAGAAALLSLASRGRRGHT